jgi:integrase/recombinase XerD
MRSGIILHSPSAHNEGRITHATNQQASSDDHLLKLWLHGRGANTQRAYRGDVARFLALVTKPLRHVTLAELQDFADSIGELAPASQCRVLSSVKSLLAFGHRIGYLSFDVGGPLRLPATRNRLSERILDEGAVHSILAHEPSRRNRALLRLLYAAGLRVSELSALTSRDLQERGEAGQVTVFGKGGKTRTVLLSPATWQELRGFAGDGDGDTPVFRSRKGGTVSSSQVLRIVRAAAHRAGIQARVSPHWLRHAHASHALERGCPIHLVQATLGHASVATTGRYLHARPTDSSARYLSV